MTASPAIVSAFFAAHSIPDPAREFVFAPPRKWRFDFAWPDRKVALEVEGGVFTGGRHTSSVGFLKDISKYNTAESLGWHVLRCTPKTLLTLETINLIKQTRANA